MQVRGQLSSLQSSVQALAAASAASSSRPSALTGPAGWAAYLVARTAAWLDASASDALSLGLSLARRVLFDTEHAQPTPARAQQGGVLLLEGPGATAAATVGGPDDGFGNEQARVAAQLTRFVGAGMMLLAVEIAFRGIFRNVKSASKRRRNLLRCGGSFFFPAP